MIDSGTLLQERFLIEEKIGTGGMGAVYRAVDQKFGTTVAIKETFYGDTDLAEAFEREARLLNGLHHPILPHVSDYFTENGGLFLVMEYIEGEDLSELLRRGEVFSVETVLAWGLEILDGLDYLHSQDPPVIHRDIKPNNLKLTPRGKIVLLDFGMAKETVANRAAANSVFGYSKKYSPLEQIEGTGTDERSDIFSLGASLYHLLTGGPPADVLARASAIVSGKPDPLQPANLLRPDVPKSLANLLSSALSLSPDKRFESARAMSSALEHVRVATPPSDEPSPKFIPYPASPGESLDTSPEDWVDDEPGASNAAFGAAVAATPPMAAAPSNGDSGFVSTGHTRTLGSRGLRERVNKAFPFGSVARRPLGRSTRSMLLLLIPVLILCLALVLFGTRRDDPVAETTSNPETTSHAAESEAVEETSSTGDDDSLSQNLEPEIPVDEEQDESVVEQPEGSVGTTGREREAATRGRQSTGSRNGSNDAGSESSARKATAEKQAARSSSPARTQERNAGSSRSRRAVEPAFEQPSVSSIEAIMTGVPYEQRRRREVSEDDLWIQDERRRRRLRRMTRQNQNRYPF